MTKLVHFIFAGWIVAHVGHAVLSPFYETGPAVFIVPVIYAAFISLIVGAWRRQRRAANWCAYLAAATVLILAIFIRQREAFGSLSAAVLVFDILGLAMGLLYLAFYFSPQRERYLGKAAS